MSTKSIIITSSGLKNINLIKFQEDYDINLIFGNQNFQMKRIFAEFISPVISRFFQSDPTVDTIKFDDIFSSKKDDFYKFTKDIFTEDTISLIKQISSGFTVEINETQAIKLRFISIILGNEELFQKINETFPPDFSAKNLDTYFELVQSCYYFSQFSSDFDFSSLINFISNNFYSIDSNKFLKLPRSIQYLIISNPNLQITSEDSFYDIICQIIDRETFSEEYSNYETIENISFFEQIEFTLISENKLRDFLSNLDINLITNTLWHKICQIFFNKIDQKSVKSARIHKNEEIYEYDENKINRFEGIFNHLINKYNIVDFNDQKVFKITSSTVFNSFFPSNVVDYKDSIHLFSSLQEPNSWIKFDFIERKVKPTFYSIKTTGNQRNEMHLKNWVIEGSNDDKNWEILDSRNNENILNNISAENTFQMNKEIKDHYRYIRLKQTGPNWSGTHQLGIMKFEIFGSIY